MRGRHGRQGRQGDGRGRRRGDDDGGRRCRAASCRCPALCRADHCRAGFVVVVGPARLAQSQAGRRSCRASSSSCFSTTSIASATAADFPVAGRRRRSEWRDGGGGAPAHRGGAVPRPQPPHRAASRRHGRVRDAAGAARLCALRGAQGLVVDGDEGATAAAGADGAPGTGAAVPAAVARHVVQVGDDHLLEIACQTVRAGGRGRPGRERNGSGVAAASKYGTASLLAQNPILRDCMTHNNENKKRNSKRRDRWRDGGMVG